MGACHRGHMKKGWPQGEKKGKRKKERKRRRRKKIRFTNGTNSGPRCDSMGHFKETHSKKAKFKGAELKNNTIKHGQELIDTIFGCRNERHVRLHRNKTDKMLRTSLLLAIPGISYSKKSAWGRTDGDNPGEGKGNALLLNPKKYNFARPPSTVARARGSLSDG